MAFLVTPMIGSQCSSREAGIPVSVLNAFAGSHGATTGTETSQQEPAVGTSFAGSETVFGFLLASVSALVVQTHALEHCSCLAEHAFQKKEILRGRVTGYY